MSAVLLVLAGTAAVEAVIWSIAQFRAVSRPSRPARLNLA